MKFDTICAMEVYKDINKFTERQRCSMIEYKTKQIQKLPNTLPGFKRKLKKHTKYAHILLFYS